jgi:hypothetical protein
MCPRSHSQRVAELCLDLKCLKQQNTWRNIYRFPFPRSQSSGAKHRLPCRGWGPWNLQHKHCIEVSVQTRKALCGQPSEESCWDVVNWVEPHHASGPWTKILSETYPKAHWSPHSPVNTAKSYKEWIPTRDQKSIYEE